MLPDINCFENRKNNGNAFYSALWWYYTFESNDCFIFFCILYILIIFIFSRSRSLSLFFRFLALIRISFKCLISTNVSTSSFASSCGASCFWTNTHNFLCRVQCTSCTIHRFNVCIYENVKAYFQSTIISNYAELKVACQVQHVRKIRSS